MSPAKRIYLSIIIFGAIAVLLTIFVILPLLGKIKRNSEIFSSERNKMAQLAKEKDDLQKTETVYRNYQTGLDSIERLLVSPEVPIEFINFLEENAQASDIDLEITSLTRKVVGKELWPSLFLQLSLKGAFSDFMRFLDKLENGPYLAETLELNATKNKAPEELETIFLLIKVFTKQ